MFKEIRRTCKQHHFDLYEYQMYTTHKYLHTNTSIWTLISHFKMNIDFTLIYSCRCCLATFYKKRNILDPMNFLTYCVIFIACSLNKISRTQQVENKYITHNAFSCVKCCPTIYNLPSSMQLQIDPIKKMAAVVPLFSTQH